MPDVPAAQTQRVDGQDDWLSQIGQFAKRMGVGAASGAVDMAKVAHIGMNPGAAVGEGVANMLAGKSAMPGGDAQADVMGGLRNITNTPEPTDFAERLPEELGGAAAFAPMAGAGLLHQGINAALSVGLPEGLTALGNFLHPAQAGQEPDPYAAATADPDPYAAATSYDQPAPFAPRVDPTDHRAETDPYAQATAPDWLDNVVNDKRYWAGAAAIAATALGAVAAMKYSQSSAANLAQRVQSLSGYNITPELTSIAGKFRAGILDKTSPLDEFFDKSQGQNPDLFKADKDLNLNRAAQSQKISGFYQTGKAEIAGATLDTVAPADIYNSIAKMFRGKPVDPAIATVMSRMNNVSSPDMEHAFDAGLTVKNELDIRSAAQTKWLNSQIDQGKVIDFNSPEIRPNLWDHSTSDLQRLATAWDTVPEFRQMHDQIKTVLSDVGTFMKDAGLIDGQKLTDMRNSYPNYIPIMQRTDDKFQGWLNEHLLTQFDQSRDSGFDALMQRSLEHKGGISGRATGADAGLQMPALASMDQYLQNTLRQAQINQTRRWFLGQAMNWQKNQPSNSAKFFTSVGDNQKGDDVVTFYGGGQRYNVKVNDPAIASALQGTPTLAHPLWSAARTAFQSTVTGALAPWFSLYNLGHMVLRGAVARQSGTAFGYIDYLTQKMSDGRFGVRGDPTALLGGLEGTSRLLYGVVRKNFASMVQQSIMQDGMLSKIYGTNAQAVADAASDAFARTTMFSMQKAGVGHGLSTRSVGDTNLISPLATAAPAYGGNPLYLKSLYNAYHDVLGAVRNGAEAHYFALNSGQAQTQAERSILGALTRDIGGDPAKQGSSKFMSALASAVPYLNVTLQGNARLARAAMDSPLKFATGLSVGLGTPLAVQGGLLAHLDPEERDQYYKLTPEERTSFVYIPMRGVPAEQWAKISLAPELRGPWAAANTMLDMAFGLSTKVIDHQDNRDIRQSLASMVEYMHLDDLKTGATSQLYSGLPPAINVGAAAAGMNFNPMSPSGPAQSFGGQRLDPIGGVPTKEVGDIISTPVEKILTGIIGTTAQIGIAVARDFAHTLKGTDSVGKAFQSGGEGLVKEFERRVPEVPGTLWNVEQHGSTHNSDMDMLTHKDEALKNLARVYSTQVNQGGAMTPAGQGLVINHGGMQDTEMSQVLQSLSQLQSTTYKGLIDQRANQYAQMAAINGSNALNRENRERLSNQYVKTIQEINRAALDAISVWENQQTALHPLLVQRLGGPITLEKLVGVR